MSQITINTPKINFNEILTFYPNYAKIKRKIVCHLCLLISIADIHDGNRFDFWCFNAPFSNISAISWRPVLVVEEARVPGETHRLWASNW